MRCAHEICFLLLSGQILFLMSPILSRHLASKTQFGRCCSLHCNSTDRSKSLYASSERYFSWESYLKLRSPNISSVADIRLVEHIMMDGNIVGMMHLDVKQVNTESQDPLQINIDSDTGIVSGHYFNFNDHKPTFKLDAKDQATVSLTGGLLTAPYVMDQFHFHIYCTRTEAEQNTLDRAQVPGELHLVFFREKYHSYNKALHRFQDGLAVIAIYLEVGEDVNNTNNNQISHFLSHVDYISHNENHTVATTASVKQLAVPVFHKHAQYDAYRGNLVEPLKCNDCVDVFLMKERFTMSVKQMTEFRKAPHCVENDWGF